MDASDDSNGDGAFRLALLYGARGAAPAASVENPCVGPEAGSAALPRSRVGPAADLYVEHRGPGATAAPTSTPAVAAPSCTPPTTSAPAAAGRWSCAGASTNAPGCRANQAIYRVGGGRRGLPDRRQLHFSNVGYEWGGSYWKVHDPLSMEIWSLNDQRHARRSSSARAQGLLLLPRPRADAAGMRRSPSHRGLSRLQPGPRPAAAHARHLGRLVGHLPRRLRPPVDQRRRPARLLRLRDAGRPAEPALRVERAQQPLGSDHPPPLPRRPPALLS